MYDQYYTGSDVNVYLYYKLTDRRVHIDKALGIGYNHNVSSAPVYVLGDVDPAYFTRGNSLVQGNIDLAFKSIKYLKVGINHLLNKSSLENEKTQLLAKVGKEKLTSSEVARLNALQSQTITDMSSISISEIFHLFDIIIEFNNSNSSVDGVTSSMVLEDVKFISESMNIYSTEESALVDRITFLAKNKRELKE